MVKIATLTLTKAFVNLVSTGASVSAQSDRDRDEAYTQPVVVKTYAGGRRRSITGPGEAGTFGIKLLLLSSADRDLLHSWIGQLVQVRDTKGRLFLGTYPGVVITEWVAETLWNVQITLTIVTATVGV